MCSNLKFVGRQICLVRKLGHIRHEVWQPTINHPLAKAFFQGYRMTGHDNRPFRRDVNMPKHAATVGELRDKDGIHVKLGSQHRQNFSDSLVHVRMGIVRRGNQ